MMGKADAVQIALPKGGMSPVFPSSKLPTRHQLKSPHQRRPSPQIRRWRWLLASIGRYWWPGGLFFFWTSGIATLGHTSTLVLADFTNKRGRDL